MTTRLRTFSNGFIEVGAPPKRARRVQAWAFLPRAVSRAYMVVTCVDSNAIDSNSSYRWPSSSERERAALRKGPGLSAAHSVTGCRGLQICTTGMHTAAPTDVSNLSRSRAKFMCIAAHCLAFAHDDPPSFQLESRQTASRQGLTLNSQQEPIVQASSNTL